MWVLWAILLVPVCLFGFGFLMSAIGDLDFTPNRGCGFEILHLTALGAFGLISVAITQSALLAAVNACFTIFVLCGVIGASVVIMWIWKRL